jgi:hypothetical protein
LAPEGRLDGLPEEALALLLGHDAPKNDEAISLKGYPLFGAQSAARRLGDRSGLVHERRSPWQGRAVKGGWLSGIFLHPFRARRATSGADDAVDGATEVDAAAAAVDVAVTTAIVAATACPTVGHRCHPSAPSTHV